MPQKEREKARELVRTAKMRGMSAEQLAEIGDEIVRSADGQNGKSCDCSRKVQQLEQKVARLEGKHGGGAAGKVSYGDRDEYLTGGRQNVSGAKGGDIRYETLTVPSGASTGTIGTVEPASSTKRGRLSDTYACSIYAHVGPALNNDIGKIEASMFLLESTVNDFKTVPLLKFADTADGEIQRAEVGVYVPSDTTLAIQFDVVGSGLSSTSDGTIIPYVESGDECPVEEYRQYG